MSWNAAMLSDAPIVEFVYTGTVTREDLASSCGRILEIAASHPTNLLLGDLTALDGGHSVVDLYVLVEGLAASEQFSKLREAILLPTAPPSAEMARFWETLCFNRGSNVRTFNDRQPAIDWLLGNQAH